MTPAERFADLAVKYAGVPSESIKDIRGIGLENDSGIVIPLIFGFGEKPFTLAIIASRRELEMNIDRIESLFMQRLENALRVAGAHQDETGVTETDMNRMLKDARESIAETPESA